MKKLLSVIAIVGLAIPAFAQDDFSFGGGDNVLTGNDINALFGGGGNNRGNQRNNNDSLPDPESMLLQLKDLLKTKKAPMTKDQEKTLLPFLESEIKEMRTVLEAQFSNRGNNRGNNNNNSANTIAEFFTLVTKHNTELLAGMKSDLTPDQASLITKAEKDKKTCTVMLDQFNPAQLQNRGNNNNNNNRGGGNFNFPGGFEDLIGFDGGGGGGRGGNNNRGNNNNNNSFFQQIPDRAFCTTATSTTAERLAPISQVLTKGKKPLTADQEKKFSGLIEARLTLLQDEMKATDNRIANLINEINNQFRNNNNNNQNQTVNPQTVRNNIVNSIMSNLGIPNNNNNNNNNNRGRGGNNFNNGNNSTAAANGAGNNNAAVTNNNAAAANSAGNNNAAAANNNTQGNNQNQNANNGTNNRGNRGNNFNNFNPQAEIRKKNEELLDKVAAKLNPDQGAIISKYKYDQIKARGGAEKYRAIMEEEKTPLTPEQLTQIQNLINAQNQAVRQFAEKAVQEEIAKVPSLEPPPQPPNQNGQRPNPNSVNANPVAQQIVAKVMPLVSRQHALLEKTTGDTILKLLTPPQVASYKLNNL